MKSTPAAEALRRLMRQWEQTHGQHLSEGELARRAKTTQPTVHRVLSGETEEPRRRTLIALAKFFGVSVEVIAPVAISSHNERVRAAARLMHGPQR